jgi:hypothetical protein
MKLPREEKSLGAIEVKSRYKGHAMRDETGPDTHPVQGIYPAGEMEAFLENAAPYPAAWSDAARPSYRGCPRLFGEMVVRRGK